MALPNWVGGIREWAKTHKPQAAGIVIGAAFLGFIMMLGGGGSEQPGQEVAEEDMFGAGAMPEDVTTASAIRNMEVQLEGLRLTLGQMREADAKLSQALENQKNMFDTRLNDQERTYTEQLEGALRQAIDLARQTEEVAEAQAALEAPAARLRILRPATAGSPGGPPPEPPPQPGIRPGGPWVRLPIGSIVTGELLTGAFATKARGDALPVLVQLRSAYSGPNDTEIPLEDCLLIGKATADISSVRARVEAVSLSCVLPDGTAFERVVRGYLTGEDGTLGVPGKWEFRSGRWLANLLSAMGTAAAGVYADVTIAEALSGANILGSVSTSDTTERIQEFFLERAEEILPVVWVESGTPVYLVMLEGLTIDGLPAEEHYPVSSSVFD